MQVAQTQAQVQQVAGQNLPLLLICIVGPTCLQAPLAAACALSTGKEALSRAHVDQCSLARRGAADWWSQRVALFNLTAGGQWAIRLLLLKGAQSHNVFMFFGGKKSYTVSTTADMRYHASSATSLSAVHCHSAITVQLRRAVAVSCMAATCQVQPCCTLQ
jgi:hypothetical protein